MSMPKYIPVGIENASGSNMSSNPSGLTSDGTKKSSAKTDFDFMGSALGYIQGSGNGNGENPYTSDGTNSSGKNYFYNSGAKCTIGSTANIGLCDASLNKGDTAYEYIYVKTKSNGIIPGIMGDVGNITKLAGKAMDIMASTGTSSSCECVPLNVSNPNGGSDICAAAFINSESIGESDVRDNLCSHPYDTALYTSSINAGMSGKNNSSSGSKTGSKTAGSGSSNPLKKTSKEGFTVMSVQKINKNIDRFFLLAFSVLLIIILYNLNKKI